MSSAKKLATSAVTAGIKNTEPTITPRPTVTEMIQASTASGVLVTPSEFCAQASPSAAAQIRARYRPNPISTISRRASPIDFSSTVRNGGENIWDKALTAASSIVISTGTAEVAMQAVRYK